MTIVRRHAPDALAALFGISGVVHLIRPAVFEALIPPFMPAPGAIIALSGIAEIVCAVGLVRRERWAGPASAWLLVAVFPGNVWFAVAPPAGRSEWVAAAAWLRLPLQLGLIWMALRTRPRALDRSAAPTSDS